MLEKRGGFTSCKTNIGQYSSGITKCIEGQS